MYWLSNSLLIFRFNNLKNFKLKNSKELISYNFNYNFRYSFNYNFLSKQKNYFFLFKSNNKYFYIFNKLNNYLFLNFFKSLNNIFSNNFSILFVDSEYKTILPFINFLYNTNQISYEKSFFFVEKKSFTKNNFIYFYKIFTKRYNIKSIFVIDYDFFRKFFAMLLKLNLTIFTVISDLNKNPYCDYFFYFNSINKQLLKTLIYNNVISLFFYHYNLKLFAMKLNFFNKIKLLK